MARCTGARLSYPCCLVVLVAAYLLTYGALLVYADFLPYVLDNNESFSAFVHGENLYKYGLGKSFGLTDESYGQTDVAHPYVYTHQGNFPRLFTVALYAIGLRSVEAQITVTATTIGLATVFLIYHFFSKLWNPVLALSVSFAFILDYLLFAQWQLNTFKVWHAFFVFSSLVCVQHFGGKRTRIWHALLPLIFAALFYYDLVMAVFTFVLAAAFAYTLYRHTDASTMIRIGLLQLLGAALGAGILVLQLLAYYGWEAFKTDVYLTFIARNAATVEEIGRRIFEEFFTTHKIVFWYNFIDGSAYRDLERFIQSAFLYGFAVYTPYLAFLVLLLGTSIVIRFHLEHMIDALGRGWNVLRETNNKSLVFLAFVLLLITLAVTWRSTTLLTIGQAAFIALLTFAVVFVNRFSLRRFVPVLVFCRRHKLPLLVLLSAAGNVLLLHTSTHQEILGRYSPRYVIVLNVFAVIGTFLIWMFTHDVGSSHGRTSFRRLKNTEVLRLFRKIGPTAVDFVLYFSIGLFLTIAISSNRFELTTGWISVVQRLIHAEAATAAEALYLLISTGFAVAGVWAHGIYTRTTRHTGNHSRAITVKLVLSTFILTFCAFGWLQHWFYFLPESPLLPVWDYILSPWTSYYAPKVTVLLAATLSCIIICSRRIEQELLRCRTGFHGMQLYLGCVAVAYLVAYMLSPGYTTVINLQRYSPLLVFLLAPLFGATLYILLRIVKLHRGTLIRHAKPQYIYRIGSVLRAYAAPVLAAALLAASCLYWIGVQAAYFQLFPPTYAAFLKKLADAPYRGASFVSSTYAAPVAVQTRQWAYLDPVFLGVGRYALGSSGYVKDGTDAYLWLADRDNPVYKNPQYAICHIMPSFSAALAKLDLRIRLGPPYARLAEFENPSPSLAQRISQHTERAGCGRLNIPYFAGQEAASGEIRSTLRERDPSPFYNWAIVELESDFPPFLLPLNGSSSRYIDIRTEKETRGIKLAISYRYGQQQGKPEAASRLTVRFVPRSADGDTDQDIRTLYDGPTVPTLRFRDALDGYVFATVIPRSNSREGPAYTSEPILLSKRMQ